MKLKKGVLKNFLYLKTVIQNVYKYFKKYHDLKKYIEKMKFIFLWANKKKSN